MISPELEERVAEAWLASIPQQYRLGPRDKGLLGDRLLSSAIIAAPPPPSTVEMFFRNIFGRQHLTAKQLQAKASHGPGRKKADVDVRRARPSRARKQPSLAGCSLSEFDEATKPFHDLDLIRR
jgi:hypothetical protein